LCRIFLNDVALNILRPLRPSTIVEPNFESVRELCVRHCESTVALLDRYTVSWPEEYTFMIVLYAYNIAFILLALLDDPSTHDLFARVCEFIGNTALDFPMSSYVLQGLRALAWAMEVQIPPDTLSYLENMSGSITGEGTQLQDVPIAYMIPHHDSLKHLLPDDGDDWVVGPSRGIELGSLLTKWSERDVS
jgi:hypothetical protein